MECPHCQNQIEVPDLWEFFDCAACGASLQLENNELKLLKAPNENTSTHYEQEPQQTKTPKENDFLSKEVEEKPIESSVNSPPNNQEEETPEEFTEIPDNQTSQHLEKADQNNSEQTGFTQDTAQSSSSEQNASLSNILDFGNTHNQKNHFTYYLHINEIPSKALFDKICHILKNPRVRLDCPNQPSNNTLTINNLSAVQMVYLVKKLSPLSVKIHWTQKSTLTE